MDYQHQPVEGKIEQDRLVLAKMMRLFLLVPTVGVSALSLAPLGISHLLKREMVDSRVYWMVFLSLAVIAFFIKRVSLFWVVFGILLSLSVASAIGGYQILSILVHL